MVIWDQKLKKDLFSNYDLTCMPNIKKLGLQGLKLMDQKRNDVYIKLVFTQLWVDERLQWDPLSYGGIQNTIVDMSAENRLWSPDLSIFQQNGEQLFPTLEMSMAQVKYNGEVLWSRPGIVDVLHSFDLSDFPFDYQDIHMNVSSWTNPIYRMKLKPWIQPDQTIFQDPYSFVNNNQWQVHDKSYVMGKLTYVSGEYDVIQFNIIFRRQANYILNIIFVPGILISSLSLFSYFLPMEGPVRIKFTVQVLLNMVVLTILLTQHLPLTRHKIVLVEIYQNLLVFIYVILIYILCIQKYRTYQLQLKKQLQQFIDQQNILIEKKEYKDTMIQLKALVNTKEQKVDTQNTIRNRLSNQKSEIEQNSVIIVQNDKNHKKKNRLKKFIKRFLIIRPNRFDCIIFIIIAILYIAVLVRSISIIKEQKDRIK